MSQYDVINIIFTVSQIDPGGEDFEIDVRVSGTLYPILHFGGSTEEEHYSSLIRVIPSLITPNRLKDIAKKTTDNLVQFSVNSGYTPASFKIKERILFGIPFMI